MKKYPALRTLAVIQRMIAALIVGLGAFGLFLFFSDSSTVARTGGIIWIVVALLAALPLWCYAELLHVFMDIEENTRDLREGITRPSAPESLTKKCPTCAETIKMEALVCRFCRQSFQPLEVQTAVQDAKSKSERKLAEEAVDKLSRNLCPHCDAYNAWITDRQKNLRRCEVCGNEYPLFLERSAAA